MTRDLAPGISRQLYSSTKYDNTNEKLGSFKSRSLTLLHVQSRLVNCTNMWRTRGARGFNIVKKMSRDRNIIVQLIQVSLLSLALSPTFTTSARLDTPAASTHQLPEPQDQEDAVFINFPRRENSSKTARQLYLPPEEQNFLLPEVIDNRVRISPGVFRPALPEAPSSIFSPPPDVELRTPLENDERPVRFFPRHNFGQTKATGAAGPVALTASTGNGRISPVPKELSSGYVQISSMSCQNTGEELFFRASIKPPRYSEHPIIDGIIGENCRIDRINDEYRVDLTNDLFWNCGIKECSTDRERYYCLNVRFPAISGLRLKEDMKVTLRCKTQEKTASHTRRLNVKTLDTSGRNAPRVETGGYKNAFETEVGLYRKTFGSGHLFDAKIQPGGTVILGEEILLRAVVREGDGWRYSRISDVTVHYVEQKRRSKIMNSLWILDANGCLNPEVREICSREQYRVSPLETYLMFEAFMFDNMKETDEMVMNVKITGCLDGADCALNCPAGHSRRVRSTGESVQNNTVDWSDDITFRVILPQDRSTTSERSIDSHLALPYILSAVVLVTIVALLATIKIFKRQRVSKI